MVSRSQTSRTSRDSSPETAKFQLNPGVIVITDDGEHVLPGSGVIGKIGTSGLVPEGYYKDPKKSAETFKDFEGEKSELKNGNRKMDHKAKLEPQPF